MKYYHIDKYPIEIVKTFHVDKCFGLHNHASHYVISLVTKGVVTARMQGYEKPYVQGETFCVAPLEPHAVYPEKNACLLSVCIGKELIEKHTLYEVQDILHKAVNSNVLDGAQNEPIMRAFSILCTSSPHGNEAVQSDLYGLVESILNHPEEDMPLSRMSEDYSFSEYYLIRKFRKHVGLSPHQFHIQSKIRKSQVLLRKGYSIVEVSMQMGFYDQSHFDKYFRRIVGISPSEYIASLSVLG